MPETARLSEVKKPKIGHNVVTWRNVAATIGLSAVLSTAVGYMVERHDENVAKAEVATIDTCVRTFGAPAYNQNGIGRQLVSCLNEGVPGGAKVREGIQTGQPMEFLVGLREREQKLTQFDGGTVAEYGAAGPVILGGIALLGLIG